MYCSVEWGPLPVVLHQEEIIRSSSFDALLPNRVPLIRLVFRHTRIVQLSSMVKFVFDEAARGRHEGGALLLGFLHLYQLASNPLHCIVCCHLSMTL